MQLQCAAIALSLLCIVSGILNLSQWEKFGSIVEIELHVTDGVGEATTTRVEAKNIQDLSTIIPQDVHTAILFPGINYQSFKEKMVEAYTRSGQKSNVIVIDWNNIGNISVEYSKDSIRSSLEKYYKNCVENMRTYGAYFADLIEVVVRWDIPVNLITLVGEGIGAQLAAQVGKYYQIANYFKKFSTILAINPATRRFTTFKPEHRLNADDAENVQVILTKNSEWLDERTPIGTSIFVVGGTDPSTESVDGTVLYQYAANTIAHKNAYVGQRYRTLNDVENDENSHFTGEVCIMGGVELESLPDRGISYYFVQKDPSIASKQDGLLNIEEGVETDDDEEGLLYGYVD